MEVNPNIWEIIPSENINIDSFAGFQERISHRNVINTHADYLKIYIQNVGFIQKAVDLVCKDNLYY